jgi:hypothetical protein
MRKDPEAWISAYYDAIYSHMEAASSGVQFALTCPGTSVTGPIPTSRPDLMLSGASSAASAAGTSRADGAPQ